MPDTPFVARLKILWKVFLRIQPLQRQRQTIVELFALFPAPFPEGDWSPAASTFEDCWWKSTDGTWLHGWYLPCVNAQASILHCHGNAGNITHRAEIATTLRERFGVSVLLFDYRGYGRSEGVSTIAGLIRDTKSAQAHLAEREKISPSSVVLLGRSLGAALAVEVAAANGARGLVLENTFASLRQIAEAYYPPSLVRLFVKDRLNSRRRIADYRGPLLIAHGEADYLVPFTHGQQIHGAANQPKRFVLSPDTGHNEPLGENYYEALGEFLSQLPPIG